jgi:hypothetical protein
MSAPAPKRGTKPRVCPDRLRQLAAEGYSQATAALIVGCSRERVRQIADRDRIVFLPGSLDLEGLAEIAKLHAAGATIAQIAAATGVCAKTVARRLRRLGLKPNKPDTKTAHVLECLASGFTLTEAARQVGWTPQEAYGAARRHGVTEYAGARGPRRKASQ